VEGWRRADGALRRGCIDNVGGRGRVRQADSLASLDIDLAALPRMPAELGALELGKWYYLTAGEPEPHHGTTFSFPLLLRASDLQ
jgi:hypothetical protein